MYNKSRAAQAPVNFANILDGFLHNDFQFPERKAQHSPAVNICENEAEYQIHLIAPGLAKEDFKIDVDKNVLSVAYSHPEATAEASPKWIRQEFKTNSFQRSFSITDKVDAAAITANYNNGILQLLLPKKVKEELKTVSIAVQ
ncbi:MAG: Hsp20/alpha crystallin family protein [Chitinophagaceae bacterium]|nr:Hsp20/alpha crystallin family protein [Chitinophagaceae bacterium]